jgi:translation initiation factor IF-2
MSKAHLTSVIDSLKTLNTEEVAVRVVSSGVGVINENDIHTAGSSNAIIYGFNVTCLPALKIASRDKVSVRLYTLFMNL